MKLSTLKVFQSVKCGSKELVFIRDSDYDMVLEQGFVYITCLKEGAQVVTPITNTPWFTLKEKPTAPPSENKTKPKQKQEVTEKTAKGKKQLKDSKTTKDNVNEQAESLKDLSRTGEKETKSSKVVRPKVPKTK